jgi:hypothetical protein
MSDYDVIVIGGGSPGEHEARNGGKFDEQWPEWYATYMVAERTGQELPQ